MRAEKLIISLLTWGRLCCCHRDRWCPHRRDDRGWPSPELSSTNISLNLCVLSRWKFSQFASLPGARTGTYWGCFPAKLVSLSLSLSLSLSPASHSAIKTHIFPRRSCWSYSNILQPELPLNLQPPCHLQQLKAELSWEIPRNNQGPSTDVKTQLNVPQQSTCCVAWYDNVSDI